MFVHAYSNQKKHKYTIAGPDKLAPRKHTIQMDFKTETRGGIVPRITQYASVGEFRIETVGPNTSRIADALCG